MSIYTMSRKDLIAKCERDDAAVARAAGVLSDNAELQARVRDLRAELAAEKSKPPREVVREVVKKVPTQCPKQAAEIKRLEKNIASLKSQPPKEVVREVVKKVPHRVEIPTPCPKQADQIKALRSDSRAKDKQISKAEAEIERLQSQISSLRAAPPKEVVKEVVKQVVKKVEVPGPTKVVEKKVPTPCPKQAAQVKALQSELDNFAKYDMDEFRKWCRMVDVARDAK